MAKSMLPLCKAPTGNPNTTHPQAFFNQCQKALVLAVFACCAEGFSSQAGFSSQPGFLQSMPKGIIVLCLLCRAAADFSSQPGFLQSMPKGMIVLCLLCREAAGFSSQPGSQAV